MDRIENLLSETLTDRADRAPAGPVPLVERSRRWQAHAISIAASVVVIVIVAVAVGLYSAHHRSSPSNVPPASAIECAAKADAATQPAPGPADLLVPGDPVSAVRCEYGIATSALIGAYTLDAAKTTLLTSALNALVPDPCKCAHGGTPAPEHHEIVYFEYQDGSVLRLDGSIGANLDTWTNQTRTVANFSSSIVALLNQLTNNR